MREFIAGVKLLEREMSWYDNYWPGLVAVIHQAWPEIGPAQVFIDTTLERLDWINLSNAGKLGPQWAIVRLTVDAENDWNLDWPCYRVAAAVHYVALSSVAAAAGGTPPPTASEYLAQKMKDFQQAAFKSFALGTVLTGTPLSLSADDPVNVVLLDAKIPIQAAGITLTSIVVDIDL